MKVASVRCEDVDRLHADISKRAPIIANRVCSLLSRLFSLSIRWHMRADNPCRGLERNPEQKRRRYLSDSELAALMSAIEAHADRQAASIFMLLLLTGARKPEVLKMQWSALDLEMEIWRKPASETKQRRDHEVPLSPEALDLLREIGAARHGAYVFPGRSMRHH
jgi:integrase